MEKEIIGRQIKELRIYANMTLEQLAEILDVVNVHCSDTNQERRHQICGF